MIQLLPQYSMKFNCIPDSKPFTAARRNSTFLSLLLFLLLIILIPVGYSITRYGYCIELIIVYNYAVVILLKSVIIRLQPSAECGPFRGQPFMYSVVNDTISNLNCDAKKSDKLFWHSWFYHTSHRSTFVSHGYYIYWHLAPHLHTTGASVG